MLTIVMLCVATFMINANKPKDDGIVFPERMTGKPEMFSSNNNNKMSDSWDNVATTGNYGSSSVSAWTVYVVRERATVYSSYSGSSTLSNTTLHFMEDFYVAELRGTRLLLFYSDDIIKGCDYSYSVGGGKVKSVKSAIEKNYSKREGNRRTDGCIGWVEARDLLLWDICPRTKDGIFKKIAIVKDIDNATAGNFQNKRTELFADPACKIPFTPARYLNPLDFSFAFRHTQNGNVLVYNGYKFPDKTKMEYQEMGWVKAGDFIDWNTRICWEPAFSGDINDYAYSFKEGYVEDEDLGHLRSKIPLKSGERKSAQTFPRFPVVGFDKSIAHMSVLGNISSDTVDIEKLQREIEKLENSLKRINIVFVMDATNSMKPSFEAVREAVNEISHYKYKNDNVHFGVVVYRNYKDAATNGLVQQLPLTNDCERVKNFLSEVRCYSASVDPQEAMFYGLNYAADNMQWGGSISNFIILLTDVTSKNPDERGLTLNGVASKLASKHINLVSYQVKSGQGQEYENFESQLGDLTESILTKMGYPNTSKWNNKINVAIYTQNSAEKKFPYRPMAVKYKDEDEQTINSEAIKKFVTDMVEEFIIETNESLGGLKIKLAGGGGVFDKSICEELIRRGAIRRCEDLQGIAIRASGYAYMHYHPYDENKRMYVPCVFMADQEFNGLISELKSVGTGVSSNRREKLRNAAIKLILSYSGQQNISSSEDSKIIMKHINRIETECGYTFYKDVKDLIRQPDKLEDNQIKTILARLTIEVKHLEDLRNKHQNYKEQDGNKYYYILLEDMPMVIKKDE